jgi:hypothetical protein
MSLKPVRLPNFVAQVFLLPFIQTRIAQINTNFFFSSFQDDKKKFVLIREIRV